MRIGADYTLMHYIMTQGIGYLALRRGKAGRAGILPLTEGSIDLTALIECGGNRLHILLMKLRVTVIKVLMCLTHAVIPLV